MLQWMAVLAAVQHLTRAQVDSCDAVFILCDKAPESAKQEDLQTVMACLAIGQYIQVSNADAVNLMTR
jgi:hypothetical protein